MLIDYEQKCVCVCYKSLLDNVCVILSHLLNNSKENLYSNLKRCSSSG